MTTALAPTIPESELEAEMCVLGALLDDPNLAMHRVRQLLPEAAMFATPAHREIYAAMLAMADRGAFIEPLALRIELETRKAYDIAGGLVYIAQLVDSVPTAANAAHHAGIVRDRAFRRQFRAQAQRAQHLAEDLSIPIGDAVSEVVSGFVGAGGLILSEGLQAARTVTFDVIAGLEERQKRGDSLVGVTTGLRELDDLTGGYRPGSLVVLAARPSVGKTAQALWTVLSVAAEYPDQDVLVFSLEMSKPELMERMLAIESGVFLDHITRAQLTNHDYLLISQAAGRIMEMPIFLDTDLDSPARIRLAVQHHMATRKRKVSLVVVDYLQLMRWDKEEDNRVREIGLITRAMKREVAHDLETPVLLLSQLSRKNVSERTRAPEMSDLRDSGEIEQNADLVVMLHWDWKDPVKHPDIDKPWGNRDRTEVYLRKQRNGPTGEFDGNYVRRTGRWFSYRDGGAT